jgi:hypothetical protein
MVTGEIRAHMFESLNIEDDGTFKILGGHEFQQTYQIDVDALSDIWFSQGAKTRLMAIECVRTRG